MADKSMTKVEIKPRSIKIHQGDIIQLQAEITDWHADYSPEFAWTVSGISGAKLGDETKEIAYLVIPQNAPIGVYKDAVKVTVTVKGTTSKPLEATCDVIVVAAGVDLDGLKRIMAEPHKMRLMRTGVEETPHIKDSVDKIRNCMGAVSFESYTEKIDGLVADTTSPPKYSLSLTGDGYLGMKAYTELKEKTQEFLQPAAFESPYLNKVGVAKPIISKREKPVLPELIWAYWMEEGYLVQTMNAICYRFQNIRPPHLSNPLTHLDIDPLRPLNNLIWGYIGDESFRLTLKRRVYEYDHQLGFRLYGKAVPRMNPADSRTNFLGTFNNLLHLCSDYYRETADVNIHPDGYPMLQALKDVHLILSEGAGNQYGDMAWTARQEFLMTQWMLARPEMKDFLRGRSMITYPEEWMGAVDAMKRLQGKTDASVRHFRDLANCGELIVLTIRHLDWDAETDGESAKTWAEEVKKDIQTYLNSYHAVTGIDLTAGVDKTIPSVLIRNRITGVPR